jgi:hypothetical protein
MRTIAELNMLLRAQTELPDGLDRAIHANGRTARKGIQGADALPEIERRRRSLTVILRLRFLLRRLNRIPAPQAILQTLNPRRWNDE